MPSRLGDSPKVFGKGKRRPMQRTTLRESLKLRGIRVMSTKRRERRTVWGSIAKVH